MWPCLDARPPLEGWGWYGERLEFKLEHLAFRLEAARSAETHASALAGVPHPQTVEKLTKYEAHLERGLYKALHELEALQDKRAGKDAPLAREPNR